MPCSLGRWLLDNSPKHRKGPRPKPLFERFWSRVRFPDEPKEGDCWNWTALKTKAGYGIMGVGRRPDLKNAYAHRLSWQMQHGPILNGLHVCHSCDNPSCVRPDHLFLGTAGDNMRDMWSKGRGRNGARLTREIAEQIREKVATGQSRAVVARELGVSPSLISMIVSGSRWPAPSR